MGRSPCCSKVGLRRGPWSAKEDSLLANYIQQHGEGQWRSLPKKAGLLRCGKSCRLRWMNYLRPGIKRGNISEDEEDLIVRLHRLLGNRWSLIAGRLPGRTDNEIKNYWNTHLLKKLNLINSPNINLNIVKPTTTTKAKKKKQKKKVAPPLNLKSTSFAAAAEDVDDDEANRIHNNSNNNNNMNRTTKVYMPKPIRVSSSVFSRSNSYDSLATSGTSSSGEAAEKVAADYVAWPPLFEVEDDFLGGGCVPAAVLHHHSDSISGDVNMWEKVYDEYMQLL